MVIDMALTDRDAELNERYKQEPWGKLAVAAGFVPVNTESSARQAFRYCAERIADLEAELAKLRNGDASG